MHVEAVECLCVKQSPARGLLGLSQEEKVAKSTCLVVKPVSVPWLGDTGYDHG